MCVCSICTAYVEPSSYTHQLSLTSSRWLPFVLIVEVLIGSVLWAWHVIDINCMRVHHNIFNKIHIEKL